MMGFEQNDQSQKTQITVEQGQTLGSIVCSLCEKKDLRTLKVGCIFLQEENPEKILNVNAIGNGLCLAVPANFKDKVNERVGNAEALASASAEFDRQYAEYQADPKGSLHRQTEAAKTQGNEVVVAADEQLQQPLPEPVSVIFPQPARFMPQQADKTPDEVPFYLQRLEDVSVSSPTAMLVEEQKDIGPQVLLPKEEQKLLAEMARLLEEKLIQYARRGENIHLISVNEITADLSPEQKALIVKIQSLKPEQFGLHMPAIQSEPLDKAHAYFVPGSPDVPLSLDVKRSFQAMASACEDATGEELVISSGYRSDGYQFILFVQKLLENHFDLEKTAALVALPGYSEHGDPERMALDLRSKKYPAGLFQKSPAFEWMLANAQHYNFHLSYEQDNEQGVSFEPWHWKFGKSVQQPAATLPVVVPEVVAAKVQAPIAEPAAQSLALLDPDASAPVQPETHESNEAEVARWKEFVFGKLLPMGEIKVVAEAEHKTPEELARETANDLIDAMVVNEMALNAQTIAICLTQISREGAFYEDALIPDPKEFYSRYKAKFKYEIEDFFARHSVVETLARPYKDLIILECENKYRPRLMQCKTEHQFNDAVASIVKDIEEHPTGKLKDLLDLDSSGLIKGKLFERLASFRTPIRRIGTLQVDIDIARNIAHQKGENLSEDQMRDRLYDRRQNLVYGLALLKDSMDAYTTNGKIKVDYVFADFNAGRFASRNAAFQDVLSQLNASNIDDARLVPDGDLLRYDSKCQPLEEASQTEELIRTLVDGFDPHLTDDEIRADLLEEKSPDFTSTRTYQVLMAAFRNNFKREPPLARIPQASIKDKAKTGHGANVRGYVRTSIKIYDEMHDYVKAPA